MKTTKIQIDEKTRRFNEELHDSDRALDYKFDREPVETVIAQLNINEFPSHGRSLARAYAELKGNAMKLSDTFYEIGGCVLFLCILILIYVLI